MLIGEGVLDPPSQGGGHVGFLRTFTALSCLFMRSLGSPGDTACSSIACASATVSLWGPSSVVCTQSRKSDPRVTPLISAVSLIILAY